VSYATSGMPIDPSSAERLAGAPFVFPHVWHAASVFARKGPASSESLVSLTRARSFLFSVIVWLLHRFRLLAAAVNEWWGWIERRTNPPSATSIIKSFAPLLLVDCRRRNTVVVVVIGAISEPSSSSVILLERSLKLGINRSSDSAEKNMQTCQNCAIAYTH
jgi:hypothetical protein